MTTLRVVRNVLVLSVVFAMCLFAMSLRIVNADPCTCCGWCLPGYWYDTMPPGPACEAVYSETHSFWFCGVNSCYDTTQSEYLCEPGGCSGGQEPTGKTCTPSTIWDDHTVWDLHGCSIDAPWDEHSDPLDPVTCTCSAEIVTREREACPSCSHFNCP